METIQEMRQRHQREIDELQSKCPHPKLSDWMHEEWAPSHSTLFEVRICEACERVISRRTHCCKCGKATEDYKEGIGTPSRPCGAYYCLECFERTEEEVAQDKAANQQMKHLMEKL